MELGRVFISSVFGGMLDRRELAADAARLVGLEPVLTERHVAQAGTVRERLASAIERCDTYVGLFESRRGTVPEGTDSRAITEEEFLLAKERGLRRLVFIAEVDPAERDPELKAFLDREVSEYSTGVWIRPYKDDASLAREIAAALSVLRPRVVLTLDPLGMRQFSARLHLEGVKPAWSGEALLGPVVADLKLEGIAKAVFGAFLEDASLRVGFREDIVFIAGIDLASRMIPGELGKALETFLDQAAHANRLVTLEIRTADSAALAIPWELLSFSRHRMPVRQGLLEIVRHVPTPGQDLDPTRDPAPEIPADHIAVLGFTASPLEDQEVNARLGTGGMGDSDLFWEREQENLLKALDDLVRTGRGRLILPDTGDKEELRIQLARKDRPQIVHLSCHGGLAGGQPALFLEDAEGHRAPVTADDLLAWIRAKPGLPPLDLLVLSACDSAEARGLADRLVRGGVRRILGMQSTVSDSGATAFAEAFYTALGQGTDLPAALRAGRVELLAKGLPNEWAIPTLTLSRDAGPLVAPRGSATPVPTSFEVARQTFEIDHVTYLAEGYVGRREVERRLRRAFEKERVIAIHGLGGIGKSTLAARFLERRRDEGARLLVLYAGRELAPASLMEEIAKKVGVERSGTLPPDQAEQQFQRDLQAGLRAVVPTILFLDNFEDNQDADGHLRNPALGEALADLVQLGGPGFRLIFTSRLVVELPDLPPPVEVWNCDLGDLSPSGCRKLRLLDSEGLGSLDETAWRQVMFHLGGHPKALEILGGYLRGKPDRVRTLVETFDQATRTVDDKLAAKRQERGRRLLVDTVLAEVPEERLPSFDRLCLLEEPLPTEELEALLAADGVSDPNSDLGWLRDHGLLARKVSPTAVSGGDAVHRLLASRRENALAEREGEEAARAWHLRVAEHFEKRKGPLSDFGIAARHRDAAGDRAGALGLYDRWALNLRDRHAYAACIQIAQEGLRAFLPGETEGEKVGAASLWNTAHEGLIPLGRMVEAGEALRQALNLVEGCTSPEGRFQRARAHLLRGRALFNAGSPSEAQKELEAAEIDLREGGHERERAVALGDIARLRSQAGDVAGAMKLHEERLRIFDQLGDVRSHAVTLGDIALLRSQAGDVAGAMKLLEEKLHIVEQLGDVRSRAVTLGDIAFLRSQAGAVAEALTLHEERLRIFDQLGDVRSRAVTLGDIARLRSQAGDVAGAREFQEQNLEISRELGDVEGVANAQFYLASLDLRENRPDDALSRLAESWDLILKIGHVQAIAVVGNLYGSVLAGPDRAKAVSVLRTSLEAFQRLGMTGKAEKVAGLLKALETPGGETE